MMKFGFKLSIIFSSLIATQAHAASEVPIEAVEPGNPDFQIQSHQASGSFCYPDSIKFHIDNGGDPSLFVEISDINAEVGPGLPKRESRASCNVNIQAKLVEGWSYAFNSISHINALVLEEGAKAYFSASIYGAGRSAHFHQDFSYDGPVDYPPAFSTRIPSEQLVWSPCDSERSVSLRVYYRLDSSNDAHGWLDSYHYGPISGVKLGILWRKCATEPSPAEQAE